MPNPWMILAAVLAVASAFALGSYSGRGEERTAWTARIEKERADAAQAARAEEHRQQEQINDTLRKQNATLGRVNAGLRRDIDGLRNRPERPAGMPPSGRSDCSGGSGAELSRPDAEFLVGEAARADELRAGLDACYAVIDTMNKKGPAPSPAT